VFNRVLVPLDGSLRAERSLPVAASIARAVDGEVLLVRVVADPASTAAVRRQPRAGAAAAVLDDPTTAQDVDEAVAASYLRAVGAGLESDGVRWYTDVVTAYPAAGIVASAREHKVELVVICSHGWSGLTEWALGGTAEKIVRAGVVSTFVLHEGGPLPTDAVGGDGDELRVLVPYDGSDSTREVIPQTVQLAAALAGTRRIAIHLFRVVNVAYPGNPMGERTEISESVAGRTVQEAHHALAEAEGRMNRELGAHWNLHVTSSLTANIDVAGAIIRMAETGRPDASLLPHFRERHGRGFDLIAVSPFAVGGPGQLLPGVALGSIAGRIIYGTKLPTFVARPSAV
jgi:nucleotide-binding universal stress UspA family protein